MKTLFFCLVIICGCERNWSDVAEKAIAATVIVESSYYSKYFCFDDKKTNGTGVLISRDGWIATNAHVVVSDVFKKADRTIVEFVNGEKYTVEEMHIFVFSDLALLKISTENKPYLKIRKEKAKLGEPCLLVGNSLPFIFFIKEGIVVQSPLKLYDYNEKGFLSPSKMIAHSASVSSGFSGGPLVDKNGEIIGINNAFIKTMMAYGVAISAEEVFSVLGMKK